MSPHVARVIETARVENNPALGGRERPATICFPDGSTAVVPAIPSLIAAVTRARLELPR